MPRSFTLTGLLVGVLCLAACSKYGAGGARCDKDSDCDPLVCGPDHTCQPKQAALRPDLCRSIPEECVGLGRCSTRGSECFAGSDAECRQAIACSGAGHCTARGGECVASSDEDCRKSDACRENGQCTLGAGRCIAASDADCAVSNACKKATTPYCTARDDACCNPAGVCVPWGGMTRYDGKGACVRLTEDASGLLTAKPCGR
jgi:hypothetical protein